MSMAARYDEQIVLPRAIRFPIELIPPDGFDAERLETWPRVVGRLEYVEGRLLYMPPCGDEQQEVVTDVVITVGAWVRAHREFVLGTNEAGMRLAGMTRAADAAVWRRELLGPRTGGLRRVPPVLAIEVAAQDELEGALEEKARWYLSVGVSVVWLVLPAARQVVVTTAEGSARFDRGAALPEHAALPGLEPRVDDFFVQVSNE
jgi:Uma2 family endonuclease